MVVLKRIGHKLLKNGHRFTSSARHIGQTASSTSRLITVYLGTWYTHKLWRRLVFCTCCCKASVLSSCLCFFTLFYLWFSLVCCLPCSVYPGCCLSDSLLILWPRLLDSPYNTLLPVYASKLHHPPVCNQSAKQRMQQQGMKPASLCQHFLVPTSFCRRVGYCAPQPPLTARSIHQMVLCSNASFVNKTSHASVHLVCCSFCLVPASAMLKQLCAFFFKNWCFPCASFWFQRTLFFWLLTSRRTLSFCTLGCTIAPSPWLERCHSHSKSHVIASPSGFKDHVITHVIMSAKTCKSHRSPCQSLCQSLSPSLCLSPYSC